MKKILLFLLFLFIPFLYCNAEEVDCNATLSFDDLPKCMQKLNDADTDDYQKTLSELATQYTYTAQYQEYNSYSSFLKPAGGKIIGYSVGNEDLIDYINDHQTIKSIFAPEQANSQHTYFSDCSTFMYTVYKVGFCYDMIDYNKIGTKNIVLQYLGSDYVNPLNVVPDVKRFSSTDKVLVYYHRIVEDDKNTSNQNTNIEEIAKNIQIGDIVASIKYTCKVSSDRTTCNNRGRSGNAHMMMYVGDGKYIDYGFSGDYYKSAYNKYNTNFASGPSLPGGPVFLKDVSYWWEKKIVNSINIDNTLFYHVTDSYNPAGSTFTAGSSIEYTGELAVLRPLNAVRNNNGYSACYNESKNRIKNPGLAITKTSSLYENNDVESCDEITYTVTLTNHSDNTYNVPVKNTITDNVTLISGDLDSNVIIGPGEEKQVQYKVKVNSDVKAGDYIVTEGNVNGVSLNTLKNRISNNLNVQQKKELKNIALNGTYASTIQMISDVYKQLYSYNGFDNKTEDDFINSVYNNYDVDGANYLVYSRKDNFAEDDLGKIAMKELYGGYFVFTPLGSPNKPGDFRVDMLQPGDIITVVSYSGTYTSIADMRSSIDKAGYTKSIYLYLGDTQFAYVKNNNVELFSGEYTNNTFIRGLMGDVAYTVHRPSVLFEKAATCKLVSVGGNSDKSVANPATFERNIYVYVISLLITLGLMFYIIIKIKKVKLYK